MQRNDYHAPRKEAGNLHREVSPLYYPEKP